MSESRIIIVNTEADIINARMYTRQMAKDAGLSIMDQARVSLAVSSLARIIGLGDHYPGQIMINRLVNETRSGLQVIWTLKTDGALETIQRNINDSTLFSMVDDLHIDSAKDEEINIIATRWK